MRMTGRGGTGKDRLRDAVRGGDIKNILLLRCQKIGDMLTFLPTLLCVRELFPSAGITLLCSRDGLPIAERIPFVNIMLLEDVKKNEAEVTIPFDLMITSSQDEGRIKFKKKWNIRFAIGVLPEKIKGVSLKHRWQYRYFTHTERYSPREHDVERNLKALNLLGMGGCLPAKRSLWISSEERKSISALVPAGPGPLVVVSPSGSRPSKNWPAGHFALLCDTLIREHNARVVFTGRGDLDEKQKGDIVSRMSGKALSVVNRTSFGEISALIERADLVISVDSGPAHIASYLNRPLIVLFGPGDHDRWRPWHSDASLGKAIRTYCRCGTTLHTCRAKRHCLDAITPEEVYEAAVQMLAGSRQMRSDP